LESFIGAQRETIFRNVEVLIYVFDVESREIDKDLHYYQSILDAILQNSKDAKIFCLIHKMDLVPEEQRDTVSARQRLVRVLQPDECLLLSDFPSTRTRIEAEITSVRRDLL
jgi:Ras-related GTP-binding protein A/B